jgi:phage baseplate assembly protein gpV
MLLEILSKEYLAIAFFEGDTYVVKTFRQKIDLDEIIEDLISANILYGTMVSSSLVWAKEQFGQTNASRNLCLIFSDGNFFDFEDACHEFDVLRRQGVKNIVISIESRNQPKGEKIEQLKASGTDYIDIRSGEDALTVVTRILGKDLRFSMSTDSI